MRVAVVISASTHQLPILPPENNALTTFAVISSSEVKMFAPTMSGLALHLDVDRKTITNYSNKEDYFPTIRKARSKIEAHIEKRLYGNNVTGCIFNLKNNFGWKDKSEIDNTSSDGSMTPTKITRVVIDESTDTDS